MLDPPIKNEVFPVDGILNHPPKENTALETFATIPVGVVFCKKILVTVGSLETIALPTIPATLLKVPVLVMSLLLTRSANVEDVELSSNSQ